VKIKLTSSKQIISEKPVVTLLVKTFPASYGT